MPVFRISFPLTYNNASDISPQYLFIESNKPPTLNEVIELLELLDERDSESYSYDGIWRDMLGCLYTHPKDWWELCYGRSVFMEFRNKFGQVVSIVVDRIYIHSITELAPINSTCDKEDVEEVAI